MARRSDASCLSLPDAPVPARSTARGGTFYAEHLPAALRRGLVSVVDLRRAAGRVLTERIRLGEFDPVSGSVASQPQPGPHGGSMHVTPLPGGSGLALRAARRSLVLLSNRGDALPLRLGALRAVSLTGPFGDGKDVHLANYHGRPSHTTSVLAVRPGHTRLLAACMPQPLATSSQALEQRVGRDRVTFSRGSRVRKPLRGVRWQRPFPCRAAVACPPPTVLLALALATHRESRPQLAPRALPT